LQADGRYVKVKVVAKMSIADQICQDIDNPAVWINIRNSSFLSSPKQSFLSFERSLKETVQEFNHIASPASPDLNDVLAGGILYSIIKQLHREAPIGTRSYGSYDTIGNTMYVGLSNRLPENLKSQLPVLSKGQGLIQVFGNEGNQQLVVTGIDEEGLESHCSVKQLQYHEQCVYQEIDRGQQHFKSTRKQSVATGIDA